MNYMLMFYENEADFACRQDPVKAPAYWGAWTAYAAALQQAGIFVHGNGLTPPEMATVVRLRDNRRLVQDGPVSVAKEQLGGYFVIDVPDLDAALAWAARSPTAATGTVEVRPVLVM